jgi:hypothetical protein
MDGIIYHCFFLWGDFMLGYWQRVALCDFFVDFSRCRLFNLIFYADYYPFWGVINLTFGEWNNLLRNNL